MTVQRIGFAAAGIGQQVRAGFQVGGQHHVEDLSRRNDPGFFLPFNEMLDTVHRSDQ